MSLYGYIFLRLHLVSTKLICPWLRKSCLQIATFTHIYTCILGASSTNSAPDIYFLYTYFIRKKLHLTLYTVCRSMRNSATLHTRIAQSRLFLHCCQVPETFFGQASPNSRISFLFLATFIFKTRFHDIFLMKTETGVSLPTRNSC
jgi:hypothetical protein